MRHLHPANKSQMIPPADIRSAEAELSAQDTSGLRKVCMCCKRELPGSNPTAIRTSHGLCNPLCEPALEMGYGAYLPREQGGLRAMPSGL